MERYALIEEWPNESLVSFRELPDCLSTAPTAEEAITEYLRWLKQNKIFFLEEEINSINDDASVLVSADSAGRELRLLMATQLPRDPLEGDDRSYVRTA